MSVVLFVLGALSVLAGIGMLAMGIPVKEFSFGNTLVLGGITAIVGGFIVIGLGTIAAQLMRVAEMLGTRQLPRNARPLEPFEFPGAEARAGATPNRIPFPPRPQRDHAPSDTMVSPAFPHMAEPTAEQNIAPMLPNPDIGADEAPLSPRQFPSMPAPLRAALDNSELAKPLSPPAMARSLGACETESSPAFEPARRAPPPPLPSRQPRPPNQFDSVWPTQSRGPAAQIGGDLPKPARAERIPRAPSEEARPPVSEPIKATPVSEPRAIAILKSGVVDGMGYTLYVDGSIEAELPQGTVRFASINDLRVHLENS